MLSNLRAVLIEFTLLASMSALVACDRGNCAEECGAEQQCIDGQCRLSCSTRSDCGADSVCFLGYCAAGHLRPDLVDGLPAGDSSTGDSTGDSSPVADCGNGNLESGEACDGVDLGDQAACTNHDYDGGVVTCLPTCVAHDLSACLGQPTTCGNGNAQSKEQCDDLDLAGASCASLGYAAGTLACNSTCSWDVSGCSGP